MRDAIENVSLLQKQINELQIENQLLRSILNQAGISYSEELKRLKDPERTGRFDPNQGARIIHPREITEKMANKFYSYFWGRQDLYGKRNEKKNGESGYHPQCYNFWKENCPRKYGQKIACNNCPAHDFKQLRKEDILDHLYGKLYNASDVIGVYPLLTNNTCRFLVYDFDNHEKGAEKHDFANTDDEWIEEVEAMRNICVLNGIDPLVERSRSGRGAHIWIFFDKAISAKTVRRFGYALLERGAEQINLKSFKYYDRMLPAQDVLPEGGMGNLIALPLQGQALRQGNSAFVDENWNAYPDQWQTLYNKPRLSESFLEAKLQEWNACVPEENLETGEEREKPWNRSKKFAITDVDGTMNLTLAEGIYVDTIPMKPGMQNKIRRLAAFHNPEFYKNKAIGTSNFDTPRWIYLGKDYSNGYIEIPRGLFELLTEQLENTGIPYEVSDERQKGRSIKVRFNGELKEEQKPALQEMLKHDNGILHAATAFGKTVVCAALIAERKVNTLIILESSSLIEQWFNALNKFLVIEEELPIYKTKTGREKRRASIIGTLQGEHDSLTGIIDIAMAGSLEKKGEYHKFLQDYGMIIVDECHHAASDTISKALRNIKAKYVYGVTATPMRGDGLEKINEMVIGPIRYHYTAKDKAKAQGIDHLVYPRFTRAVSPRGLSSERMHPNEAYEIVRNNETRDDLIISDVIACIAEGRTPVILSRYKDHSEKLYEKLKAAAKHVFLMTGNNSKREHKQTLEQMNSVPEKETMLLIATGGLIGEGFDFPRLDTLIMATPVSFRSVVEQYAGRLNRDYNGKKNVIVYDYVDSHIDMFEKMYMKRLKAYKQIGYDICGDIKGDWQEAGSVFDEQTYLEPYQRDLLNASKSIIISSPAISGPKVYELIQLLKDRQATGVQVTIVTWEPDSYGFGDSSYWMQLHEEMRQAGFYMKTVEDYCNHFAIMDQEIVWYGSMNLLAKIKDEDSMLRVEGKKIAEELIEAAFIKINESI